MIPCKTGSEHPLHWKKLFAQSYVGLESLNKHLKTHELEPQKINREQLEKIDALFPIQLNQQLLDHFPSDGAVLRQYLPDVQELYDPSGYNNNPVGDIEATQLPGVIKKYRHRALLITSNTCPVHCRYCFRKDFPYPDSSPYSHMFKQALAFCEQDTSINEIILSGGDPLSLSDALLKYLFESIENIPHVKTIRIHTKFPSIFPQRITNDFLSILSSSPLNKMCVFHINHPDEISKEFCDAAQKIKRTNTTTMNQSVLLKQVNNNADILIELSHKLFNCGILPYYLHMLDRAKGTHHFLVPREEAESLMDLIKRELPGYLVPKLAQEIAGENSKIY